MLRRVFALAGIPRGDRAGDRASWRSRVMRCLRNKTPKIAEMASWAIHPMPLAPPTHGLPRPWRRPDAVENAQALLSAHRWGALASPRKQTCSERTMGCADSSPVRLS